MKTETTLKLEQLLARKMKPQNDFYVFECTIGWFGGRIVDCIKYDCQRQITCYEIKQSRSDFHSKADLTFIGHKNYFVMPLDLYEQIKDEIPPKIGVFVAIERMEHKSKQTPTGIRHWAEPVAGFNELYCIKNAYTVDLKADKEVILSSMLRSMQRDKFKE